MRRFAASILVALAAWAAVPPVLRAQSSSDADLRLRAGDAIRVEVLESRSHLAPPRDGVVPSATQPDEYGVDVSGVALVPIAGNVRVAGRPFAEVRAEIEAAFAAEFAGAVVRVTPLIRVAVLGEVRAPGLLSVDPTMSFADVLAAAGGLTELANTKDVRLIRGDGEEMRTDAGRVADLSLPLRSGDRILVGRRSWLSTNVGFVLGAGASVVAAVLTALIVR